MPASTPVEFTCEGDSLLGIVEEADSSRGVVIVVGGPQYRVGSHRQFTFLARDLASAGHPTLRFDHRGIGDSEGESTFEDIGPDIRASIDTLLVQQPQVTEIVLWGLCDAASAILMYATSDPRVGGVVILNPWVRSEQTLARSYLSSYYTRRLLQADFWRQLVSGRVQVGASIAELFRNLRKARAPATAPGPAEAGPANDPAATPSGDTFQVRMMRGLAGFDGSVLLILSGNDLTASEFRHFVDGERRYRRLVKRSSLRQIEFAEADHTFSTDAWRGQVSRWTSEWIGSW